MPLAVLGFVLLVFVLSACPAQSQCVIPSNITINSIDDPCRSWEKLRLAWDEIQKQAWYVTLTLNPLEGTKRQFTVTKLEDAGPLVVIEHSGQSFVGNDGDLWAGLFSFEGKTATIEIAVDSPRSVLEHEAGHWWWWLHPETNLSKYEWAHIEHGDDVDPYYDAVRLTNDLLFQWVESPLRPSVVSLKTFRGARSDLFAVLFPTAPARSVRPARAGATPSDTDELGSSGGPSLFESGCGIRPDGQLAVTRSEFKALPTFDRPSAISMPPTPAPSPHCRSLLPPSLKGQYPDLNQIDDGDRGACLFYTSILGAPPNPDAILPAFNEAMRRITALTNTVPAVKDKLFFVRFSAYMDNGKCMAVPATEWASVDVGLSFYPESAYQGHMCMHGVTMPGNPMTITVPYDARPTGGWLDHEFIHAIWYATQPAVFCPGTVVPVWSITEHFTLCDPFKKAP